MITNERQYKITRSEAERFRKTIADLEQGTEREGIHPRLLQAEREAMDSQLADLQAELSEYEHLKSAKLALIEINTFDELAEGLIKARIAAGLSQKALAERLNLKEQQVQRYEAERYGSASFQRLREVASAIGVRIKNEILLPVAPSNFEGVVNKLRQVGIDREFLLSRLLTSADAARATGEVPIEDDSALSAKTGSVLERIYGWTPDSLFGAHALAAPRFAAAEARFKMPAGRSQVAASMYAAYANYLAVVVLKACSDLPMKPISDDPRVIRAAIIEKYATLSLRTTLHFMWDLGVAVLPLRDQGTFHGACWRYQHRNVIILKQRSRFEERWLFDLLHELFHASQQPESETFGVIESDETSVERRNSDEEIAASQFAGDVVLDGRAEELAQECVKTAQGSVERLKGVVPGVATLYGVNVGALANYLAFRLSWQGISWWGTASNLQTGDLEPWAVARDVFLERFPFHINNQLDRDILERALH